MKLENNLWKVFFVLALLIVWVGLAIGGVAVIQTAEAQGVKDMVRQPQQKVDSKNVQLMFQGYQQGSSMHMRAEAIAELIRKFVGYQVTVTTGKGLTGVMGFMQGKLNMYLNLSPYSVAKESLQKEAPDLVQKFKETLIIPTYEKFEILLVLDKVKGSSLTDLLAKKHPIKVGFGGINPGIVAEKILMVYGVSLKDIESWGGKVDAATGAPQVCELMKDGFFDTHMSYTGAGSAYIEDLGATRKVRLLPIAHTDSELKAVQKILPEFYRVVLPPKTFRFVKERIPTVAFSEYLVAKPDLPEDVVYNITKAIWENTAYLGRLSPEFSKILQQEPAMRFLKIRINEIHPGAMRYYKEKGWLQ